MIAGIDGGLSGGISALYDNGNIINTWVMPTTNDKISFKHEYNIDGIINIFKTLIDLSKTRNETLIVYLEKAAPRPVSGKRACFMNGFGFGLIQGLLSSLQIKYVIINPQTWMKALDIKSSSDEKGSINWCLKKFPTWQWKKSNNCKNYHTGLTDSCGIAYFGCMQEHNA
jgi:hypothetical protein